MFTKKLASSFFAAVLFSSTSAFAAGFHLMEGTITGMGRAFAGAGMNTDDISAIAYNPAGLSFVKNNHFQAGASYVRVKSTFTGSVTHDDGTNPPMTDFGSTTGKISGMVPSVFAAHRISENAVFGVGVFAPFGLTTSYKEGSLLAAQALDTDLQVIEFAPVLSYRLAGFDRKMTIGLGLAIQSATARLSSEVILPPAWPGYRQAIMKGDSTAIGMQAGIGYEFTEKTRIGLGYRAAVTHELEGKLYSPAGVSKAAANLNLPSVTTLSAVHQLDKFTFSGTVRYTGWSRFKELLVMEKGTGGALSYVHENWRDTWTVAGGADWHVSSKLTLRGGLGFEQTPVPDAQHRTARIPDSDRFLISFGASFMPSPKWQVDVAVTKFILRTARMNHHTTTGSTTSTSDGKYTQDNSLFNIVGLSVQYKF